MRPLSHIRVPQSTYYLVQSWLVRPFHKAGPALKQRTWDIMPEDRSTIERSIWTARPTRLVQTARESIDSWLGVSGAEILLIDYHQSHLIPFADGDGGTPVPVDSHPAGRAFASAGPSGTTIICTSRSACTASAWAFSP